MYWMILENHFYHSRTSAMLSYKRYIECHMFLKITETCLTTLSSGQFVIQILDFPFLVPIFS